MGKYISGTWEVKTDEEKFQRTLDLKYKLQMVAGLYQNDITITGEDFDETEKAIKDIYLTLMSDFEDTVHNLKRSCNHENVERYQDFCPHKGYKTVKYCGDCKEDL